MSDNLDSTTKQCTRCKRVYPATSEHFIKRSACKSGLGSWCKNCAHEYNQTPAAKQSKKKYAETDAGKTVAQRAKEKHKPKGIVRDRLYNATPKAKLARQKYGKSDKAKVAHKRYSATLNGQLSRAVRLHTYRARKRSLNDCFTVEDWKHALEYFEGCCAVCDRPPGLWHTLAADHWIPLSSPDCPGTIPENIIPLCHGIDGCNNSKHAKLPLEWLTEKFGKRKAMVIFNRIGDYFSSLELKETNG